MQTPLSFVLVPFSENPVLASKAKVRIPNGVVYVSTTAPPTDTVVITVYRLGEVVDHSFGLGTITVCARSREDGVEILVEDSGEGIDRAALPHIFERFYRADPSRADRPGAGLGLSIAQALAQAHGSQIAVESEPGQGARFSMLLRGRSAPP